MVKTVAQRQADYRAKRAFAGEEGNGERQLNMWISTGANRGLARLANRYGVTKRELVERLIKTEDERVISTLEMDTPEWDNYFSLRRNERKDGTTQKIT